MIERCIFCATCRKEKFFGMCATCDECKWDYISEAWPLNWEPSIGNKNEIAIHIHDLMRKMPSETEDSSDAGMHKVTYDGVDYFEKNVDKAAKIINGIKDSGDRTEFSTGAVRDIHAGKGRFDLLPWHAIWDVAKHCENGAFKYGERNVNKGIPQHSLIDSAYRHMTEYLLGFKDEEHLRAACWNLLWALEQCTTHPELLDIPWKDE